MSEPLKVSMTPEDINKALKWSRDTIASQAAEIERLRTTLKHIVKQWPDTFAAYSARAALQPKEGECLNERIDERDAIITQPEDAA